MAWWISSVTERALRHIEFRLWQLLCWDTRDAVGALVEILGPTKPALYSALINAAAGIDLVHWAVQFVVRVLGQPRAMLAVKPSFFTLGNLAARWAMYPTGFMGVQVSHFHHVAMTTWDLASTTDGRNAIHALRRAKELYRIAMERGQPLDLRLWLCLARRRYPYDEVVTHPAKRCALGIVTAWAAELCGTELPPRGYGTQVSHFHDFQLRASGQVLDVMVVPCVTNMEIAQHVTWTARKEWIALVVACSTIRE